MNLKSFLSFSFILSLALHISFILILKHGNGNLFDSKDNEKLVEITILDSSSEVSMQIVEQDQKPVNNEIDPHAKHLSQFNQKVVKETRAQSTQAFKNTGGTGLERAEASQAPPKNTPNVAKIQSPKGFRLDRFKPAMDWSGLANKNGGGNGREISSTTDYLKDYEKGLETSLSTREFLYYTYFKRIKSQIQQHWEPNIKGKISQIMKSGRQIASIDRVTKLVIILNNEGDLTRIQVIRDSGILELDQAAIDAFKSAAPFPNPPSGLVEQDGTIKIRWDFVLEA